MTLAIAAATFFGGFAIPGAGLIGTEFVPQADYSETGVTFYTPVGSSLDFTETKARQVEAVLREFPEVRNLNTTVNTVNAQGKNYATVFVQLTPRSERKRNTSLLAVLLRVWLSLFAGFSFSLFGLS